MKIVSFNLRSNLVKDGINNFRHRVGMIYEKIKEEMPEIMAFQEVGIMHLDMLTKLLPEYSFVGRSRKLDKPGEGLFTAVRKDAVEVLDWDIFWLGPDTSDPATRFPGQSVHPRLCVRSLLRVTATGETFRLYNTHTDHMNEEVAVKGLACVLEQAHLDQTKVPAYTVVLGDMNAEPYDGVPECIASFTDRLPLFESTEEIPVTFHNYGTMSGKIDYIFLSQELKSAVKSATIWDDLQNGIYLSDHYPVCVELA